MRLGRLDTLCLDRLQIHWEYVDWQADIEYFVNFVLSVSKYTVDIYFPIYQNSSIHLSQCMN